MRISDWSSDVCSSDLRVAGVEQRRIDDRGIDELAFTGAVAVIDRIADRDRRQEAIAGIAEAGEAPQRPARHAVLVAAHAAVLELDAGQAGAGLVVDRKSVELGKSVSVSVGLGGRRIRQNRKQRYHTIKTTTPGK